MPGYHSCMNRRNWNSGSGGRTRTPREMWEIKINHEGLNKFRHIRGSDKYIVERKANVQLSKWDEMWEKKLEIELRRASKTADKLSKELKKAQAESDTVAAKDEIESLNNILKHTLSIDDAIDWNVLKESTSYKVKKPKYINPKEPEYRGHPRYKNPVKPNINDSKYKIKYGILALLFKSIKSKKDKDIEKIYENDLIIWGKVADELKIKWKKGCDLIDLENKSTKEKWDVKNNELLEKYNGRLSVWNERRDKFRKKINKKNARLREKKELYESGDEGAVIDYFEMVLSNSIYPEYFPQNWVIEFNSEERIIVIDYDLLDIESIPNVKEIKYIASRNEFSEKTYTKKYINDLYDSVVYQISIRTIHEIFESDVINSLDTVVFNGRMKTTDKATGREVNYCIVSVQAEKDEFMAIKLEKVDPKECFKLLKGVSGTKLYAVTPVAPIVSIDYKDNRITDHYDVAHTIDEEVNLAAMDWQDFENLIRELFEKEFAVNGGEVKVTQASRDGGVDAIAFDPDPIRGGKIVIQAKRYTNVVGVSAVRDLYGTTLNEGATKGILVTTSNYGPDAYKFSKGKPITLMSGANLLHLLEKHGHKAKIDIKEAKKILSK